MSNVDNEKVLDKGYIEVVDVLGDDLTPVNAARVSFGGRSKEFTSKIEGFQSISLSTSIFHHLDISM